jgi:hypothetical protein
MSLMNAFHDLGGAIADTAGAGIKELQRADTLNTLQQGQQQFTGQQNDLNRAAEVSLQKMKSDAAQDLARLVAAQQAAAPTDAMKGETSGANAAISARAVAGRLSEIQETAKQQAASPSPEIKSAIQFDALTPAQKQSYREEMATKAGLPAWAIETPSSPTGTPAAPGQTDSSAAPATSPSTNSNRNEQALQGVPGSAASIIKGMVDGRVAPPSSIAISKTGSIWPALISKAAEYDPTFDQTTWAGRVATRKSFTAGQDATAVTALNTALGHASKLADQFTELNNNGGLATPLNMVVNPLERFFGDQRQTNTQQTIDALASEARKVFAASGGGNLTELQEWQKNFPLNGSQSQQRGALTNFVELLDSRLQSLAEKYNRGMGRTDDPMTLLQPNARAAFEKLTGKQPDNSVGLQMGRSAPAAASSPADLPPLPEGFRLLQ